ncbi:CCA tRNA nucleotidyltransferase [Geomobilimonas luticola]|uniref:CCA tRNA nucleotidyltransferase n=1 Tax=Geomobilimonas luticola TaxID=1114878 RepID=A0ABS5SFL0_9BACT|nr:CCA tRNA nucleotidyltransferase [Geomobilimonas luticola]MBT0654153.1 CCA tRNA nucleotidyltransferase [Geomobilimonas luticola]
MEEDKLITLLSRDDIRLLAQLATDCRVEVYLVGGGVRDLLLDRPSQDLDFALDGECAELPRRFAVAAGGTFFWLDEVRRHGRVVLGRGEGRMSYDFVLLQGGTIEQDLLLRDFTINALALLVVPAGDGIIDLQSGMADLQRGIIRTCSPRTFADDPVRLVRAFRFAATLGFTLADSTRDEIPHNAHLLEQVAAERVRDELFRILDVPASLPFIRQLAATGLLPRIVGTGYTGAIAPSFDRMGALEQLLAELERHFPADHGQLAGYLEYQVEDGITVHSLLKMSAFTGSVGSEKVAALAVKLRLGNRSRRVLQQLCRPQLPVGLLLPPELQTSRAMYRLFRDESPAGLALVLLALAGGVVTREAARRFVGYYCREYDAEGDDLYLTGAAIMTLLGTGPGPHVGAAAARLREAESRGMINSRGEAEEFLRKNQLTKPAPLG